MSICNGKIINNFLKIINIFPICYKVIEYKETELRVSYKIKESLDPLQYMEKVLGMKRSNYVFCPVVTYR